MTELSLAYKIYVTCIATGFFACLLLALWWVRTQFHHWEIRGVREMRKVTNIMGVRIKQSGEPVTLVLERCDGCKKVRTRTFPGVWSFEELTGLPEDQGYDKDRD